MPIVPKVLTLVFAAMLSVVGVSSAQETGPDARIPGITDNALEFGVIMMAMVTPMKSPFVWR